MNTQFHYRPFSHPVGDSQEDILHFAFTNELRQSLERYDIQREEFAKEMVLVSHRLRRKLSKESVYQWFNRSGPARRIPPIKRFVLIEKAIKQLAKRKGFQIQPFERVFNWVLVLQSAFNEEKSDDNNYTNLEHHLFSRISDLSNQLKEVRQSRISS